MRRLALLGFALLSTAASAGGRGASHPATVYVHGHTTRRGTYVAPHHRTAADHTRRNNWSHAGNLNPYTGQEGTKP